MRSVCRVVLRSQQPCLLRIPQRFVNIKELYTQKTVPGSERTPNTKLGVSPIYVDGSKYDTRVPGVEVIPNSREVLLSLYAKGIKLCDEYGVPLCV